ncbi:MAG: hypothetical protein JO257_04065, partial [Deltaproteobacteria bacterium]|nr:hypothetical protein [Deltaproteobacteria bacterium]
AAQIETAQRGDVVVLRGDQTPPPRFELVDAEAVDGPMWLGAHSMHVALINVYRRL